MADPALLSEAYAAIEEAAESMDTDAIEETLNELSEYELPADVKTVIDDVREKFNNFDYEGITELIKSKKGSK